MDDGPEAEKGAADAAPSLLPPALPVPAILPGAGAAAVSAWFDTMVELETPALDGSLAAERDAAQAYARMAKAENTRRAYRAAVRAWCAWCLKRDLPPLPAAGADVAAFLAGERGGKLHAGNPETAPRRDPLSAPRRRLPGAHRRRLRLGDACRHPARRRPEGPTPAQEGRGDRHILRRLLAPIAEDLRGLRDRALLLVGFAGALRRSELAAIRVEQLEKTDRGIRLTLPRSKGAQEDAVTVPLPYGDTELCPVHALEAWLQAAGLTAGPVFRRIWLPPRPKPDAPPGAPPPRPRIGATAITRRPSPRSSRPAPSRPASGCAISAATASSAAP